jgi:hypothetical protein
MGYEPTPADDEALAALALAAAGADDETLLFLVGSMADGLANRGSDYDLYMIGTAAVEGSETAARRGERTATIAYHHGREVNLAILDPAALAALRDSFRQATASLSDPAGIAQVVDDNDVKVLHRLRTGRALRRTDLLEGLREDFGTDHLARYLFNAAAVAAVNRSTDIDGELAEGRTDSAAWMHRELLVHTGQCVLAAAGVTVPNAKWLLRLLQGVGGAGASYVARQLLAPADDLITAIARTRAELAAVIDDAGDTAGPYVRDTARPKLG